MKTQRKNRGTRNPFKILQARKIERNYGGRVLTNANLELIKLAEPGRPQAPGLLSALHVSRMYLETKEHRHPAVLAAVKKLVDYPDPAIAEHARLYVKEYEKFEK